MTRHIDWITNLQELPGELLTRWPQSLVSYFDHADIYLIGLSYDWFCNLFCVSKVTIRPGFSGTVFLFLGPVLDFMVSWIWSLLTLHWQKCIFHSTTYSTLDFWLQWLNESFHSLTHSLTAALDQLRVVAISTTSGPGSRIGRHWWVDPGPLPPAEARFSVDIPVGASSQQREVYR